MAGQHQPSLVPVNSPVGPTACSKYINVLYAPFHPRNFGGVLFAFFNGVCVCVCVCDSLSAAVSEPVSLCLLCIGTGHIRLIWEIKLELNDITTFFPHHLHSF